MRVYRIQKIKTSANDTGSVSGHYNNIMLHRQYQRTRLCVHFTLKRVLLYYTFTSLAVVVMCALKANNNNNNILTAVRRYNIADGQLDFRCDTKMSGPNIKYYN